MPLTHETEATVADHTRSLEQLVALEASQYFFIATALEEEVGADDARQVIKDGLHAYACWRGQRIRSRHDRLGQPRTLTSLLRWWGSADVHGLSELGWGAVGGTDSRAHLHVTASPDITYLREVGRPDLATTWWRSLFTGVFDSYFGMSATTAPQLNVEETDDRISVTLTTETGLQHDQDAAPTDTSSLGPRLDSTVLEDPSATQAVLKETVDNRAALLVFLGRAMMRSFDASGEHALRVGIQRFGAERGRRLRESHLAADTELNLQNMMSDFDYGGESVWEFRDEGTLNPATWQQDCTYCPFASVWRELGGLDLGLLYDVEFHVAQFKAYHPDIRVKWTKLQTRGDAVCEFRFDLPTATSTQQKA